MQKFHDYRFHDYFNDESAASSFAYNVHEQDQAIQSAQTQVSIATSTMSSANASLSKHVRALHETVNDYLNRLNKMRSASSTSSAAQASESASQIPSNFASQAISANGSMGKILVSLSSGVGVVYSLVNKRNHKKK